MTGRVPALFSVFATACYHPPGACPDSDERMGPDILGTESWGGGHCDLLCPDGTRLGSREGTWAVECGYHICAPEVYDESDPMTEGATVCGDGADVQAWLDRACPECNVDDIQELPQYPYEDEACAFEYRHISVSCDFSK